MTDQPTAAEGLRERKKRATRRALSDAALRLGLDRGLDRLTVEEISEAVGVSTRTFFNYFASKEEALLGDNPLSTGELPVRSLVLAADSVLDGLYRVALAAAEAAELTEPDEMRLRRRLMERHPTLVPRLFAKFETFQQSLAAAVAARVGAAPTDTYPQLMAAVGFAAMRVAWHRWTIGHGNRPLEEHIDEVFGLLESELEPERAGRHAGTAGCRGDAAVSMVNTPGPEWGKPLSARGPHGGGGAG